MIAGRYARYQKTLRRFAVKHRQRTLRQASGIDFSSNDYLALANSPRIKQALALALEKGVPVGSGGSRLLCGNHDAFGELESYAATFFQCEKALYFNSGYAANLSIFSTLPQRGDLILYDERVHASMLDGIRLSRAEAVSVEHNNVDMFASMIQAWRNKGGVGKPWIAVESLYSMDGDCAPLKELANLININDGILVIDEAHATGVFGPDGRGFSSFLAEFDNVIVLHTCSKALGVSGAILCLNAVFYDYLINHARPFIFSTAPSPLLAIGVGEALRMLIDEPQRREQLQSLYQYANKLLITMPGVAGSGLQIIPIIVKKNHIAICAASRMRAAGYDVHAIRPPTVAEGSARLRISITLNVNEDDIRFMFFQLSRIIETISP